MSQPGGGVMLSRNAAFQVPGDIFAPASSRLALKARAADAGSDRSSHSSEVSLTLSVQRLTTLDDEAVSRNLSVGNAEVVSEINSLADRELQKWWRLGVESTTRSSECLARDA